MGWRGAGRWRGAEVRRGGGWCGAGVGRVAEWGGARASQRHARQYSRKGMREPQRGEARTPRAPAPHPFLLPRFSPQTPSSPSCRPIKRPKHMPCATHFVNYYYSAKQRFRAEPKLQNELNPNVSPFTAMFYRNLSYPWKVIYRCFQASNLNITSFE